MYGYGYGSPWKNYGAKAQEIFSEGPWGRIPGQPSAGHPIRMYGLSICYWQYFYCPNSQCAFRSDIFWYNVENGQHQIDTIFVIGQCLVKLHLWLGKRRWCKGRPLEYDGRVVWRCLSLYRVRVRVRLSFQIPTWQRWIGIDEWKQDIKIYIVSFAGSSCVSRAKAKQAVSLQLFLLYKYKNIFSMIHCPLYDSHSMEGDSMLLFPSCETLQIRPLIASPGTWGFKR